MAGTNWSSELNRFDPSGSSSRLAMLPETLANWIGDLRCRHQIPGRRTRIGCSPIGFSSGLGQLVKREVQDQRFFGSYPVTDENLDAMIGLVTEHVREESLV